MARIFRAPWAAAAVLLVGLVSGCGRTPSGPSEVRSLRVEGPTSLSVGDVVAFRVIHETPRETRDVTDTVRWTVAPPFLTITRGTATAVGAGAVSIRAELDGVGSPPLQVQVASRIDGTYTMTIGGGICKWSPLPRDITLRTYRAQLVQRGTGLDLQLSDATFEGHAPGTALAIAGRYDAGTDPVTFDLPKPVYGWDDYEPVWAPITEVLPDGSRIQIVGTIRATPGPAGLSGTFKGFFAYSPGERAAYQRSGDCESDTHQFTLTR
jgi:hypothetical protein